MRRSDPTDPIEFHYEIPMSAESLTPEEQARDEATGEWPARLVFSGSVDEVARVTERLGRTGPVEDKLREVIRDELAALKPALRKGQVPQELTDDTFVDQDSGLYPREAYLRAARRHEFPSRRSGNKVLARWGDVQKAFSPTLPAPSVEAPEESEEERLAKLAASYGYAAPKGKTNGT